MSAEWNIIAERPAKPIPAKVGDVVIDGCVASEGPLVCVLSSVGDSIASTGLRYSCGRTCRKSSGMGGFAS